MTAAPRATSGMSLEAKLAAGLDALGISLEEPAQRQLLAYLELLAKWNRVYNLTAVRDVEAMLAHHILDSLSVLPHLEGVDSLADVGAGAGLPGIPLAIANPKLAVVLVESTHKKCAFMQQALIELELSQATVMCERAERVRLEKPVAAAISRAFADLAEFVRLSRHLVRGGGLLLAMKGVHPDEELARLPSDVRVREVVRLDVPGLEAKRHLVVMEVD